MSRILALQAIEATKTEALIVSAMSSIAHILRAKPMPSQG
jgi:hypothetical protein